MRRFSANLMLMALLILFATLLTGCGSIHPSATKSAQATIIESSTPTTQVTGSPSPVATSPTPTQSQPTSTASITPVPTLPQPTELDRLRLVYRFEGNLYIQTGSQPPVQLTDSGKDHSPLLSADGKKLVFFRGRYPNRLFRTINADGTGEQALATNDLLIGLNLGYDESTKINLQRITFIPDTHQLLFNTYQTNSAGETNQDLLKLDTDTGNIEVLMPPGSVQDFTVSPDGRRVAVQVSGQVDVIDIDGKMIRQALVRYSPTQPYEDFPNLHWVNGSESLIVLLPVERENDWSGPLHYTVWHYALDGSAPRQIPLQPQPMGGSEQVSPDGKWISYQQLSAEKLGVLYLGDLQTASTRMIAQAGDPGSWSPDSQHYAYLEIGNGKFIDTTDGDPIPIYGFLDWLDESWFLTYQGEGKLEMKQLGGGSMMITSRFPEASIVSGPPAFNFVYIGHPNDKEQ